MNKAAPQNQEVLRHHRKYRLYSNLCGHLHLLPNQLLLRRICRL